MGLWAYRIQRDQGWVPCNINYVVAKRPRYDNNPDYRLIEVASSRGQLDNRMSFYAKEHQDQPDYVVKMRPCYPGTIAGPPPRRSPPGGRFGVWAYRIGLEVGPCNIHYVAAQRPSRYDNDPNYRLVRGAQSMADASRVVGLFSQYHEDQPDFVVKMEPCHKSTRVVVQPPRTFSVNTKTTGWVNAGWVVPAGATVTLTSSGNGTCHLPSAPDCPVGDPDGVGNLCSAAGPNRDRRLPPGPAGPQIPYGAVAGKLGANGTPFLIGKGPVTVRGPGQLFLVYNDCDPPGGYSGNGGTFAVTAR